jgi:hypothetical protein
MPRFLTILIDKICGLRHPFIVLRAAQALKGASGVWRCWLGATRYGLI